MGNQQKYIHNLAHKIAGDLRIQAETYANIREDFHISDVWNEWSQSIVRIISSWKAETLGKVAACGTHSGPYLGDTLLHSSGKKRLILTAAAAIAEAMVDNIRSELQKKTRPRRFWCRICGSCVIKEPEGVLTSPSRDKLWKHLLEKHQGDFDKLLVGVVDHRPEDDIPVIAFPDGCALP